jgi:hypothetical protein
METVDNDRLVMALAFVFLALAGLLAVVGIVVEPFVLTVSLLFGAVSYFMWYQASGRLGRRLYRHVEARARVNNGQGQREKQKRKRRRSQGRTRNAREGQKQRQNARGGFGAGPREDWNPRGEWERGDGFSTDQRQGRRQRTSPTENRMDPTTAEAYDILDLDPSADESTIRRAYREKVKDVHPDTGTGSEEEFKRVNAAYEQLTGN